MAESSSELSTVGVPHMNGTTAPTSGADRWRDAAAPDLAVSSKRTWPNESGSHARKGPTGCRSFSPALPVNPGRSGEVRSALHENSYPIPRSVNIERSAGASHGCVSAFESTIPKSDNRQVVAGKRPAASASGAVVSVPFVGCKSDGRSGRWMLQKIRAYQWQ
jgi:hypothetical protein